LEDDGLRGHTANCNEEHGNSVSEQAQEEACGAGEVEKAKATDSPED
jgi:hypothetical protein